MQIYQKIAVEGDGATDGFYQGFAGENAVSEGGSKSVSGAFMENFNLPSYADSSQVRLAEGFNEIISWKVIAFGFLMMCIMIIAGFAFLSGAVILIYRFIALIIYMILSPVMFLGMIYPKFKSQSDKWWKGFMKEAFVAPAYLFMIYIALRVVEGMPHKNGMNFGNAFETQGSNFAVFTYFFVMAGFLFAATKVAGMMSASGANISERIGKTGVSTVRGMSAYVPNAINRKFVGGAAEKIGKSLDRRGWGGGSMGRGLAKAQSSSVGGLKGRTQVLADKKASEQRQSTYVQEKTRGKRVEEILTSLKAANDPVAKTKALNGATSSQLLEIMKKDSQIIIDNAGYLSESQAKSIVESDKIDDGVRGEFARKRKDQVIKNTQRSFKDITRSQSGHANFNPATQNELVNVAKAGKDQLLTLGKDELIKPAVAVRLSKGNLDDLMKLVNENKISFDDYTEIERARNNALITVTSGSSIPDSTIRVDDILKNARAVATLPDDALRAVALRLTPNDLKSILDSGKRGAIIADIRRLIENAQLPSPHPTLLPTKNWLNSTSGALFN